MRTKTPVMLGAIPVAAILGAVFWPQALRTQVQPAPRKVLFYQDSMHPWVKSDRPGKCTVCSMDLTPIYEGQSALSGADNVVVLNSNSITVLNVQIQEVKAQGVARTLQVAGALEADETRKTIVAAPAAGRIDDLSVRYPGVEVKEGERLVTFYSPELTLEKRRFLVRARMSVQKDPTGGLAMPQSDSDPYYSDLISPQAGTVVERRVYKGQYVADGERLFTIVDLSTLWFRFDVYEQQLPWLRLGQRIGVTVPAVPGKVFEAVISFIEPMLNEATRTVKVRADIKNPLIEIDGRKQRALGLGMYAQGEVRTELQTALAVPRSAILQPGSAAYAYVEQGGGAYERRRVVLGHQGDGLWEVTQGLEEGERVVVSGSVLLDAQAQFNHGARSEDLTGADSGVAASGSPALPRLAASSPAVMTPEPEPVAHEMSGKMTAPEEESAAKPQPMTHAAMAQPSMAKAPSKPAFNPRKPVHPAVSADHPGYRNNRLGNYDAAFDAAFNRMAELRTSELTGLAVARAAQPPALTLPQADDLRSIVAAADGIGRALAEDDLEKFKHHLSTLMAAMVPVTKDFPATHPLSELVQRLSKAVAPTPAKDLVEARAQFLPLGATVAELTGNLKNQGQAFAGLKVFHCPMASKPGLWMQIDGPLRNPFFGAKMLHCGEEVTALPVPGNSSLARNNHDQPAN